MEGQKNMKKILMEKGRRGRKHWRTAERELFFNARWNGDNTCNYVQKQNIQLLLIPQDSIFQLTT